MLHAQNAEDQGICALNLLTPDQPATHALKSCGHLQNTGQAALHSY
jgi:hypothetical protein